MDVLESVGSALPGSADLNPHFHAAVDLFSSTLVVDPKLEDIAILKSEKSGQYRKWRGRERKKSNEINLKREDLRFDARDGKADMVEESARRGTSVFDKELIGKRIVSRDLQDTSSLNNSPVLLQAPRSLHGTD